MEKKNKKKLFAIIGGSVLAFVLTIALSVSITLAYFGETISTGEGFTLGLGNKLEFTTDTLGASVVGEADLKGMLPGETRLVNMTGTVDSTDTTYFLRFKLEVKNADANVEIDLEHATISGGDLIQADDDTEANYSLVKNDDGFVYVCDTAGVPKVLSAEDAEDAYTVALSVKVKETVTNATTFANNITVNGTMAIIQSEYVPATTVDALADAWVEGATQNTPAQG